MSEVLHSAGDPGATRCSESATGSAPSVKTLGTACAGLFGEIADVARVLRELGALSVEALGDVAEPAVDDAMTHAVTSRMLAAQLGALADMGAKLCGNPGYFGDADAWLLGNGTRADIQRARGGRA